MRTRGLFLGLLSLLVPTALAAQGGTVRGHVTDAQGAPLARASVAIDGTGLRTLVETGQILQALFPWAASPFGYNGRYLYARLETRLGS